MPQFTTRSRIVSEQDSLEAALGAFFRRIRGRNGHFQWLGMDVYFRFVSRFFDGRQVGAINIGDLSFSEPSEDRPGEKDSEAAKWEALLLAIRNTRADAGHFNHLLVNGYMPLTVAERLRGTPGCREVVEPVPHGFSEFILALDPMPGPAANDPMERL